MKKKVGTLPVKDSEEEKQSNEIRFFIPVLQSIDIGGRTVTADAMHTQRESAEYIVSRGGHFHFSVKGNQKNLLEAVQTWYGLEVEAKSLPPDFIEDPVKNHGRIEQRAIWLTDRLNDHVSFPHVRLAFAVKRTVTDPKGKKKPRVEIAFGITSLGKDATTAEEVLATNRKHWSVETAHNILDSSHAFDEDACLIRKKHGPENMACLRRFALTVLRHHQKRNGQPITEQLRRLCLNPRRILDYLRLTGNTRPRPTTRVPGDVPPLRA